MENVKTICYNEGPEEQIATTLSDSEFKEIIFLIDNIANELEKGVKGEVLVADDVVNILVQLGFARHLKKKLKTLEVLDIVKIGEGIRTFWENRCSLFKKHNGIKIATAVLLYRAKEANSTNTFSPLLSWLSSDLSNLNLEWESIWGKRTASDFVNKFITSNQ